MTNETRGWPDIQAGVWFGFIWFGKLETKYLPDEKSHFLQDRFLVMKAEDFFV